MRLPTLKPHGTGPEDWRHEEETNLGGHAGFGDLGQQTVSQYLHPKREPIVGMDNKL